ncbi:MAG: ATP-binding protein, partial [Verrucomicrobia bacterium]|nr:ATP-binding protein [Verrucomicrobiota bacterium]
EKGSLVHTPHQPFKHWPKVFKNASTLPSAVLDRLLHHAETVILEGQSDRMKDQIETPQLRGDHSGRLAPAGRPFSCPALAAPR